MTTIQERFPKGTLVQLSAEGRRYLPGNRRVWPSRVVGYSKDHFCVLIADITDSSRGRDSYHADFIELVTEQPA